MRAKDQSQEAGFSALKHWAISEEPRQPERSLYKSVLQPVRSIQLFSISAFQLLLSTSALNSWWDP
jgi:hypothetical protein